MKIVSQDTYGLKEKGGKAIFVMQDKDGKYFAMVTENLNPKSKKYHTTGKYDIETDAKNEAKKFIDGTLKKSASARKAENQEIKLKDDFGAIWTVIHNEDGKYELFAPNRLSTGREYNSLVELKKEEGFVEKSASVRKASTIVITKSFLGQVAKELAGMLKSKSASVAKGIKRYKEQYGIGSSKYTVSYHDGKKKHNDGSDFFDIEIFKNKKDLNDFISKLSAQGYVKE